MKKTIEIYYVPFRPLSLNAKPLTEVHKLQETLEDFPRISPEFSATLLIHRVDCAAPAGF